MPPNFALKAMNTAHRVLLKASHGRFGNEFGGMPSLELTTIGRKSGQPHAVMLTAPVAQDGSFVVVASRGGDPVHPAWFLNLRENPEVTVSVRSGPQQRMRATILTSEQRAQLWPDITRRYSNYAAYQKRTSREIPLVRLSPIESR
ncbi:nitroreductase/quinone reductase family protein [Nocardia aobensis]|uniref:Nitroreductase/quinone reductase family protein n=1 Tax=Nocardia aobensis TaxID=257277 RepID=A0ABW6PA44_9NOCA|nr:nitroreductase/quinone reductase family protein [Nocardia sp. BSTN01]MBF4997409.1 nitroreductase family deazaflavin-dependent oxidoreductase [Nocardia sp. BSTN01]